jgi:hypothetical protein
VLRPWLDLEPDAEIPEVGKVGELLAELDESGMSRREDLDLELQ